MRELHAALLEFWDSPTFREKYLNDALFHNVFDTLAKALGISVELLRECKVWGEDDGLEPLPVGTGARIDRFLDNLPQRSVSVSEGTD